MTLNTQKNWLVWSNEHNAWWGPENSSYYTDIDSAGRYTLAGALANCHKRSKRPDGLPCELVVPAPEYLEILMRPTRDECTFAVSVGGDEADPAEAKAGRVAALTYCEIAEGVPHLREDGQKIKRLIEGLQRHERERHAMIVHHPGGETTKVYDDGFPGPELPPNYER